MLDTIENLITELRAVEGDKPAMHAKAKEAIKALQALAHQTQPGAGEFKWSATARKALTKPAPGRHSNPALIVARGDGKAWHSDGHYAVAGEPSARFQPCDFQEMPLGNMMRIIPTVTEDFQPVTVIGGSDKAPGVDCVELSNGVLLNRVYVTYVMATAGEGATLYSRGGDAPVLVRVNGETLGLVMPVKPYVKKG